MSDVVYRCSSIRVGGGWVNRTCLPGSPVRSPRGSHKSTLSHSTALALHPPNSHCIRTSGTCRPTTSCRIRCIHSRPLGSPRACSSRRWCTSSCRWRSKGFLRFCSWQNTWHRSVQTTALSRGIGSRSKPRERHCGYMLGRWSSHSRTTSRSADAARSCAFSAQRLLCHPRHCTCYGWWHCTHRCTSPH